MSATTEIIDQARLLYRCDVNEITDANMLVFLNNTYHDLITDIVNLDNEDRFFQTWYTNTVAFQNRYAIPGLSVNGIKKLRNVYVRYSTIDTSPGGTITCASGNATFQYSGAVENNIFPDDIVQFTDDTAVARTYIVISVDTTLNHFTINTTLSANCTAKTFTLSRGEYKIAEWTNTSNFDTDPNTLRQQQDASAPMYRLIGDYIEIFPRPNEDMYYGIKLEGIIDESDLTLTSTATDVKIKSYYYNVIAKGMGQFIYQTRGLINEKNDAKMEYEKEKADLVKDYSDRVMGPIFGSNPNLFIYE